MKFSIKDFFSKCYQIRDSFFIWKYVILLIFQKV